MKSLSKVLHDLDEHSLDFTREKVALGVRNSDLLQLDIVVQEEGEILERHIDIQITSIGSVLLNGLTTSSLSILVNLFLDIVGGVRN